MATIQQGVRQAVENCLKVQPGERAVIITDRPTLEIGRALQTAVGAITDPVKSFIMEDFGPRPIDWPQEMADALAAADVSIYAAQGAPGELQSFRMKMLKAIEANQRLRHAHMIGITPQIMADGMCTDYREIQRISALVYEAVRNARSITVTTDRGCDFTAAFSPALKWLVSDGNIRPGRWMNLPDGEVFTSPATLNGRIVIDGCLGDYFCEKYACLEQTPVTVDVAAGRAVRESIRCDNTALLRDFTEYLFNNDANSHRVGEFAIGTNTGLTHLIYNLLQDEKFPGIHIAFGSPLPGKTGADWDSKSHVDGVLLRPTITVDGQTLMQSGRFLLP